MGTADKIPFMYTLNGAHLSALTARYTFTIIDSCEVINNLNSFSWTSLLALTASDTAVLTELAHLCALVVIIALNCDRDGVIYEVDYTVGTGADAKTAADTFLRIYFGNTALGDRDCVARADLGAVAVAKTGEGTESVTREVHICRLTGLRTCVDILSLLRQTGTVAGNVGNLFDNVLGFDTENLRDLLGGSVTAGDTEVSFVGYALGERLGVTLAAGKAASTAVCARKTVADKSSALILFNAEVDRCYGKKHSAECAYAEKKEYGN